MCEVIFILITVIYPQQARTLSTKAYMYVEKNRGMRATPEVLHDPSLSGTY